MGLNALAFRYAEFVGTAWYWPYPLLLAGFLLALLWPLPPRRIRRGPNWAIYLLLLLGYNLGQFIWLGSDGMIRGGYIWAGAASDLVSGLLCGGLVGVFARARSRDAFGHAGWAILAALPPLNLVLLAAPSREQNEAQGRVLFAGVQLPTFAWVVIVFAISGTSNALTKGLNRELERMSEHQPEDPAYIAALQALVIGADGVEAFLDLVAAGAEAPSRLAPGLWLLGVRREGTTLHFLYALDLDEGDTLSKAYRDEIRNSACAALGVALNAGATAEYHYHRPQDQAEIGVIRVSGPDCLI
jgi:hypothetical protein